MITHFAGLQLNTVSKLAVKQYYQDQLQFPVVFESETAITFQPTEHFAFTFTEVFEPVAPAHIAFEVPFSEFEASVAFVRSAGISLLRWPDGHEVDEFETGKNIYFRDGDGNLLEIITHSYVKEGVLASNGPLKVMYLREIGFPVEDVIGFREWLKINLQLRTIKEHDNFNFVIGGTAHTIVTSTQRRWIPIAMMALPPRMTVRLGVSDSSFIEQVRASLIEQAIVIQPDTDDDNELCFNLHGYRLCLLSAVYPKEAAALLNLPLR
ncbi:hypothetical protein SAMN03159341_12063 [Paenibacillus sp. 1_12]|uniref:VOC family protein n=1 Tax=Paenibacillus sp. 1_12 TaxID=1566278 RepID=UPI0008E10FAF|nr:hypothetical protein [Paenibacillus sp. 1_12]SFM20638.1 hypothetical protein SAMN03159341_12063 [Paenibacillus sp. 1_12]